MAAISGRSPFVSVSVSSSSICTFPSTLTPVDQDMLSKLIDKEFIKPEIKNQSHDLQEIICAIALEDVVRVKILLSRNANLASLSIPGLNKELSLLEFACLYHDKESTIKALIPHTNASLMKDTAKFRDVLKVLIKKRGEHQDEVGSRIIQLMFKRTAFGNISALFQNIIPSKAVAKEKGALSYTDIVRESILDLAANGKPLMLTALLNQLTIKPQLEERVHAVFSSIRLHTPWPVDISEIVFSFIDYDYTPLIREMMTLISEEDPNVDGEDCDVLYISGLSRAVRSLTLLNQNHLPQSKLIETVHLFLSSGADLNNPAAKVGETTIPIINFYQKRLPADILRDLSSIATPFSTTSVVTTPTELAEGEDWVKAF